LKGKTKGKRKLVDQKSNETSKVENEAKFTIVSDEVAESEDKDISHLKKF
jgi:hypothetical protein